MAQRRGAVIVAAAVIAAAATGGAYYVYERNDQGSTHVIESSYAFDVTNRNYVAGWSDAVVFGTVEEVAETRPDDDLTVYRVRVDKSLKGDSKGTLLVRQLGYVDGDDRWILTDQPMLTAGRSYLLAVKKSTKDEYTAVGGPEGVVELAKADPAALTRVWRTSIAGQQYPPGVPR